VWTYPLDSERGIEATPLVVDGIMYQTAPWSVVHAIDARTGKRIWTFDPEVDRHKSYRGCCDVVNRGVAQDHEMYRGTVRRFLERECVPRQAEWDAAGQVDMPSSEVKAEVGLFFAKAPGEIRPEPAECCATPAIQGACYTIIRYYCG
jgi:hypothetical protein